MSVVVEIVYNRMPQMAVALRAEASKGVRRTAFRYEANLKQRMSGVKSGRVYVRKNITHIASAPGQAPAVDTGTLINSIKTDAKPGSLTAEVATTTDYAPHLEYGTVNMEPRPAWIPEAEEARRTYFPEEMRRALGAAYR